MADFTSLLSGGDPGMWDEWLKKIASQMTQEPDRKAPLNSGLMAAGLGILANANRGFAGGVGAGGLLGLNAYNEALAAQKKDPMQQLQMMSAITGMQDRQTKQQALQKWQQLLTPQAPQSIPGDYGPGEAPNAPQQPGPQLTPAQAFMGLAQGMPGAEKVVDILTRQPGTIAKGAAPLTRDMAGNVVIGKQVPDLPQGMQVGPNGVEPLPNFIQTAARLAGEVKGAESEAAARVTDRYAPPSSISNKEGGTDVANLATLRLAATWGIPVALAREITTQFPENKWDSTAAAMKKVGLRGGDGGAANFNLQTGDIESLRPGNSGNAEYGTPSAAQTAELTIATKAREAKAIQDATSAGDIQKNLAQKFSESDLAERTEAMTKARTAMEANTTLANVRQLSTGKDAARGGMMAPTLQSLDAFMNGIGIPFNAAQFKSTEEAQTYLAGLSMAQVKAMVGSNAISDRDVIAVKAMMPQIANNPAVRLRLLDTLEKANNRSIEFADRINKHLRQNKTLDNFDYGLKQSEQQPAVQSQREAVEAEMRKRGIRF